MLKSKLTHYIIIASSLLVFSACSAVQTDNSKSDNVSDKTTQGVIERETSQSKKPTVKKAVKEEVKPVEWVWPTETEEEVAKHAALEVLDLERPLVKSFVSKMVTEHGFEKDYIESILKQGKNKESILKLISRPAEKSKEWFEYRPIFLTEKRITKGKAFIETHMDTLLAAEKKYGVPKEIITAIIGVETYYGGNSGKTRVLDALVTIGFNYPKRSPFFRKELEQFFILSREEGFDPTKVKGSYAGAMGNGQFISSSYRNFTADGDGDGKRDLWNSWPDTIYSVANYFDVHKWKTGEPVLAKATPKLGCGTTFPESKVGLDEHTIGSLRKTGCELQFKTSLPDSDPAMFLTMQQKDSTDLLIGFNNFYTITRYNRSPKYARAVYQLSKEFK